MSAVPALIILGLILALLVAVVVFEKGDGPDFDR